MSGSSATKQPTPYTHDAYWGGMNAGEASRRQSTTPQNALNGLPNQRPVQVFNSPGLYAIPPDDWASLGGRTKSGSATGGPSVGRERPALRTEDSPEQKAINFCAQWAAADCSAFDNAEFRAKCGMCLGARGPGEVAGLFYDRATGDDTHPVPTAGTCSPRAFVIDKATCELRQKQLRCEREGSFADPECAVCTSNAAMKYVEPGKSTPPTLRLYGRGQVAVNVAGATGDDPGSEANPLYAGPLKGAPISLIGISEGTTIYIRVAGESVGGVLLGDTRAGQYATDIAKLISVDTVSGGAPRREGYIGIGGSGSSGSSNQYVFRIIPAVGKKAMVLALRIPFEFVNTPACSTGPVVRTPESAAQLSLTECAGPRAVPGNYSLACLKRIWDIHGCSPEGAGYPNDIKKAPEILWDDQSNPRSLEEIHVYVRNLALTARTGIAATGERANPAAVERARVQCLGKSLYQPCTRRESDGSLTVQCMQKLYTDAGGQRRGQLWPDSEGAVAWAQQHGAKIGDVLQLGNAYAHQMVRARDPHTPQQERLQAIAYMYGITYKELRDADIREKVGGRPARLEPTSSSVVGRLLERFFGGGGGAGAGAAGSGLPGM